MERWEDRPFNCSKGGGHQWETGHGAWSGVVIGVSCCEKCGIRSRTEHFPAHRADGGDVAGRRVEVRR